MAGKTFLDELAILNSQDFLGGLSEMGKAIKEDKQNKTLVQLWNEFQVKKEGLSTTGEQVNEFNKDVSNKTDKNGFLTRGAPPQNKMKGDAEAVFNLFGYMQKEKAYLGTYEPFIQAFSVLGEDGVKIAKSLTDELGNKLTMLEKEGQIPFKQAEYTQLMDSIRFDEIKFNDYMDAKQKNEEVQKIEDFITSNELYRGLADPEDVYSGTKYGDKLVSEYNTVKDVLTNQIKEKYPNLKEGVLTQAVNYAFSLKQMKVKQIDPTEYLKYKSINDQVNAFKKGQIDSSINTVKWISQEWRNYTPEMKVLYRDWAKNPATLSVSVTDEKQLSSLEGRFANLHKALMPGGEYDQANGIINATFGEDWYKTKKQRKGGQNMSIQNMGMTGGKKEYEVGGYEYPVPVLNIPGYGTEELIRAKSGLDIINGTMNYDPSVLDNINLKMKQDEQNRLMGSYFQDRHEKLTTGLVDKAFDIYTKIPRGRR